MIWLILWPLVCLLEVYISVNVPMPYQKPIPVWFRVYMIVVEVGIWVWIAYRVL